MGIIQEVLLIGMPQQIWKSDDGKYFKSEAECIAHESSDYLMRLLFNPNGSKRDWNEGHLSQVVRGLNVDDETREQALLKIAGWEFSDVEKCWNALRLLWCSVKGRDQLLDAAPYLIEVARVLKKPRGNILMIVGGKNILMMAGTNTSSLLIGMILMILSGKLGSIFA